MTSELTKQQIASLLEKIQEHFFMIKTQHEKISQIELDILLHDVRNLYESLHQLNKINNSEPVNYKEDLIIDEKKTISAATLENKNPEIEKEIILTEINSKQDETNTVPEIFQRIKVEEIQEKNSASVDQKIMEERTLAINRSSKTVSKNGSLFEEEILLANKFESPLTIHDKITKSKEDKSWNEKLQSQPLVDLKKSIGINEKFKFVNELFDGHLQDYNESIDFLNNCKSFTEVENFIDGTLTPKFSWKKESAVYQSLILLIQRKFNS